MKSFLEFRNALNEALNENNNNNKPSAFRETLYRLLNSREIKEIGESGLSLDEVYNGLCYTMIGRGIKDKRNMSMVLDACNKLLLEYGERYKPLVERCKEAIQKLSR